jgi:hypothetical protein
MVGAKASPSGGLSLVAGHRWTGDLLQAWMFQMGLSTVSAKAWQT